MLDNLLLSAGPTVFDFLNKGDQVRQRNRERLKQHERNEAKYRNDFNRDVVLWRNESNDRDIEVDAKWQEVLGKIARDDLQLWSGISKAGLATQQAYATMMSVGATEQTGRRSSTTTNRRKAVLSYAAKMANVANTLSLSRDNAALNRSTWGNEFTRFSQASEVKNITGRPMPGTPPPSIPLENKPDLLTGLILPLAGNFIDWRKQVKDLAPPYTDEEMTPKDPEEQPKEKPDETPPDQTPPDQTPPDQNPPNQTPEEKELVGAFFEKRSRNIASRRLGSSFQLTSN